MTATRRTISAEFAAWAPWSTELRVLIDTVREVAASDSSDDVRRLRLGELGLQARRLLDRIGTQPTLPGSLGEAVEVLRVPTDVDPIHIAGALARLGDLSLMFEPAAMSRVHRTKSSVDGSQTVLPGFEPTNNQGDKDEQ